MEIEHYVSEVLKLIRWVTCRTICPESNFDFVSSLIHYFCIYCFFLKKFTNLIRFKVINLRVIFLCSKKITDLADNVVISILKFLDLQYLLQVVNKTCKRLKSIIEDNSVLWRFFDFDSKLMRNPCKTIATITQ